MRWDRHDLSAFARTGWQLLKDGFNCFIADNALTRGAAIAFYAVTRAGAGIVHRQRHRQPCLRQDATSGAIHHQLRRIMSRESADLLQLAVQHSRRTHHTLLGGLLGTLALVVTASGVFTEMEDALNAIWKAPRTESYLYQVLRGRVLSLGLVVVLGFLLMVSMVVASGIGILARYLDQATSLSHLVIGIINIGLSLSLVTVLFAVIYKTLPNKALQWRDVMVGAFGTALLFQLGQALIGFYLANFISASVYGAAGGVIVLLVVGLLHRPAVPAGRGIHQGLGLTLWQPARDRPSGRDGACLSLAA